MQILETMSASERYSFPPVVIYTGQAPSPADEERLRRYSRSVIVKGARSPERLLDEVTLFLHQVESRLPPASQRMLRAARERDELFEGKTIMIVEDDVRNIFALSSVFESRGATVTIARNGREALARIAEKRPDLVLMDVMMPEMDGLTATRELRKSSALRDLPVITLTAKAMPDDYVQCARRRRQRLHGQADRRRQAGVALPRLDDPMTAARLRHRSRRRRDRDRPAARGDLPEVLLRLPALRPRLAAAPHPVGARPVRHRQRVADAACRPARSGDVHGAARAPDHSGERHVPRPRVLRGPARARAADPGDVSLAQGVGRRVQHRRRGVLARHSPRRGGPAEADADLRDRHQPRVAAHRRAGRVCPRSHRRLHAQLPGGRRRALAVGLLHGGLLGGGV